MTDALQAIPVNRDEVSRVPDDPAALAAAQAAKTRLEAAFVMAKQFPRDEDTSRMKIINSCRRPRFASTAIYRKPQGGGFIEGPSVRFAEACLLAWGNITIETSVVFEDMNIRRLMVSVIDLESNSRFGREIVIQKTIERRDTRGRQILGERMNSNGKTVYIVAATADELLTKESAAVSKAVRNEGLRCIPADIRDEAMESVVHTIHGEYKEGPEVARKKLISAFSELKVTPKMLSKYLGHSTTEITQFEFAELRKVYGALQGGMTNWNIVMEVRMEKLQAGESTTTVNPSPAATEASGDDPTKGAK